MTGHTGAGAEFIGKQPCVRFTERRAARSGVRTITIILWDSLDDVRALAGEDYERAIIPADRLPLLTHYDARAAHYEVVSTVEHAPA